MKYLPIIDIPDKPRRYFPGSNNLKTACATRNEEWSKLMESDINRLFDNYARKGVYRAKESEVIK